MISQHFQQSMDESTGYGYQSCLWSADQGKLYFPCPYSRLRIWSREMGSVVLSRVSLLISALRLNLVLTRGIPTAFRDGVHLYRQPPSGQSRDYRVTQLRTNGGFCRDAAGIGVSSPQGSFSNGCCLFRCVTTDQFFCADILPHPIPKIGMKWTLVITESIIRV